MRTHIWLSIKKYYYAKLCKNKYFKEIQLFAIKLCMMYIETFIKQTFRIR